MQASYVQLNGSYQKGNYIWGGALTLAWKNLSQNILKQDIKLNTNDQKLLKIAKNFNNSQFNSHMIADSCYYARTGFGNETVHKINEEVSKKFPGKTTEKLVPDLDPTSIISFAFFLKQMKFNYSFHSCQIRFNNKYVDGFQATGLKQKQQILVHKYSNQDNFVIELLTKSENDHIILIKNEKELTPQQVFEKVNKLTSRGNPIGQQSVFTMPIISLSHKRELKQLIGIRLKNEKFNQYSFSQIYEIIKLNIDETGVKVQNEGKILCSKSMSTVVYALDKPFWIVLRENLNHPYFIAYITNLD